jgi:hypothetical protein
MRYVALYRNDFTNFILTPHVFNGNLSAAETENIWIPPEFNYEPILL